MNEVEKRMTNAAMAYVGELLAMHEASPGIVSVVDGKVRIALIGALGSLTLVLSGSIEPADAKPETPTVGAHPWQEWRDRMTVDRREGLGMLMTIPSTGQSLSVEDVASLSRSARHHGLSHAYREELDGRYLFVPYPDICRAPNEIRH